MGARARSLAVVTGASSGIGLELTKLCAQNDFDLVIAADDPKIENVAIDLRSRGINVECVYADLATIAGVDQLYSATVGRPVAALIANAGHGLGKGFLDQDFEQIKHVIDTNVTGTLYLIHKIGRDMRQNRRGRILVVGSIAGFMPGSFQAVYNGTKAMIDSFAAALRNELKDSGVTVSLLMPGPTETEFFERAGLMDTKVGTSKKQPAEEVAKIGFDAMMSGEGDVVAGFKNKLQAAFAHVMPSDTLAEMHRKQTEPGSAPKSTKH